MFMHKHYTGEWRGEVISNPKEMLTKIIKWKNLF